jgi:hypothetical protein
VREFPVPLPEFPVPLPELPVPLVGSPVGLPVGFPVGLPVGFPVGLPVGLPVGFPVGLPVGLPVGFPVGLPVGFPVGLPVPLADVFVVGVGDTLGLVVGFDDFDGDTDVGPVVGPTLMPGSPPPGALVGCDAPVPELGLTLAGADWLAVGSVWPLLLPPPDAPVLLEISTAMIATTPMAAAPIPANRNVRFPGLRVAGCGPAPFR